MNIFAGILAFFGFGHGPADAPPPPPKTFLVRAVNISDEKAVFATVESANVVPARARIGGTIIELKVRQGDHVEQGQVIATVGDRKLALQANSYSAQVQAAQAQMAQAQVEFQRAQRLLNENAIARNSFDQARTAYNVASSNVRSLMAQKDVIMQQSAEGAVLAPTSGRVITVPVTTGTVLMPGDTVATVAEQDFVLRLEIPERHARSIRVGDPVRLDGVDVGLSGARFGTIKLVYPQIDNGHVVADATVQDLGDYFVGERVRVWVSAGQRRTIVVPAALIVTRSGIDYARLWQGDGTLDVPIQRGQVIHRLNQQDGIEILSGLTPGDKLLRP
ncbi:MAG: efflux RND transporter periplasmic adaptor subunit [Alphaproteobacteria bacterium]|nr:efflux RND transporter periplasmic adaptor subunit [Alphaproteobacteria bacterium]